MLGGAQRLVRTGLLIAGALVQAGCTDSHGPPEVAVLRIAPHTALELERGQSYHYTVAATDGTGTPISGVNVLWHSRDGGIATVDQNGLVSALGSGSTAIVASVGKISDEVLLMVRIPVQRISLAPAQSSLLVGKTGQLIARVEDGSGGQITGRMIEWQSSAPAVARVSDGGLVTAITSGTATITASSDGQSGTALVSVLVPIAGLRVAPASISLYPGDSSRVDATSVDPNGNSLPGRSLVWSTGDPAVATVSSPGMLRATGVGTTFVVAAAEGQRDSARVEVRARVRAVYIRPERKTLEPGESVQLDATAKDEAGNTLNGREISWTTSEGDVATVSRTGLVKAVKPGETQVSATAEGRVGRATIIVSAPDPGKPDDGEDVAVLVGAGDIGSCTGDGDEATARLLDRIPGTVFTAGDNVYEKGTVEEFANCYGPTWGRHKSRTRPVPGNHEYETPGAAGYFGYFGAAAGDPAKGYYSYDAGEWHIVTLNPAVPVSAGTAQMLWLEADLDAHRTKCTAAIWHVPLFSSDSGSSRMREAWRILYEHGAELVISGHHHRYERFAPQTATGQLDQDQGIRQFVVGTGGRSVGGLHSGTPMANSQTLYGGGFGVLKLTLRPHSYEWEFISVEGKTFADQGSDQCH